MKLRDRNMLKAAMAQQHYTIRETAALAKCSPQMIGHLRAGTKTSCSPELAVRIEKALRVSPGALFEARVARTRERRAKVA